MATGDQSDILKRIKSTLPPWFGDDSPYLDGLLTGLAWALSFIYDLIQEVILQTRIKTATGGFLDMIAGDFFGSSLYRKDNETDARFLARILSNMFRERATRKAIISILEELTERTPKIFEPRRPLDTGAYSKGYVGYGLAGGYGSMKIPYQCFVDAYRPEGSGVPYIAGYGISTGGYRQASRAEYASMDMIESAITDDEIYDAINAVKPIGTIIWTRISS